MKKVKMIFPDGSIKEIDESDVATAQSLGAKQHSENTKSTSMVFKDGTIKDVDESDISTAESLGAVKKKLGGNGAVGDLGTSVGTLPPPPPPQTTTTKNVVPEFQANPLFPRTDSPFEIPTATIFTNDGTPINIPNAAKIGLTNDIVKGIQERVSNKTATPQDINIISSGTGKTPNVISAYISKGKDAGNLTEFEDGKIKQNQNLTSLLERTNDELGVYFEPTLINNPQVLSKYLNDIEGKYKEKFAADEQVLRQSLKANRSGNMTTSQIRQFVNESDAKIKEVNAQNMQKLAEVKNAINNKIEEQIALNPNIKGDEKTKQILNLTQKREQDLLQQAKVSRETRDLLIDQTFGRLFNPVASAIKGITDNGDKEDEEILNADKAFVQAGVSQKIGERLYYNNIRKQNIINEATQKQESGMLTDEDKINVANKIKEIDTESNAIKTDFTPRKELHVKYPILLKKDVVNEVNDFVAKRSSNVVGGGKDYSNGVSIEEHLKANGYDLKNPVVRDVILEARMGTLGKGSLKDYSLFGRLGSDFKDVFISSAKSIGDITGIRDDIDILADKKTDELFPTQVGETDEYKLTGTAKTLQNIAGTTGQVLGQGILQMGGMGLGRLAGLSKVAAATTGFWSSGTLTTYDNAYKDAYDISDTQIGRTTYAGLLSLFSAATERFFPEAKVFQMSGVKDAISQLVIKNSIKGQLTKELAKELLEKGKKSMVDGLIQYGKTYGINISKEAAEEVGTSAFESGLRFLYGDKNINLEEAINRAKETAYQTATGMALIGGVGAHKDISKERNLSARSVVYNAAVYNDEAIDAINKGFKQGLYSPIERDQKIQTVHTAMRAVKAVDQIEELYQKELPREQREIYVGNLTAEALLKKQFDQLPESDQTDEVGKEIQGKIKNLQEQRKQIVKEEVTINEFGDAVSVIKPKENIPRQVIEIAPKENKPTEKTKVAIILPQSNTKPNIIEVGKKAEPIETPTTLTDAENNAIETVKGIDFNTEEGKKVKVWTDIIQDENSPIENKVQALKELHEQLTDPDSEIPTGTGLGKAADAIYNLPYEIKKTESILPKTEPDTTPIGSVEGSVVKPEPFNATDSDALIHYGEVSEKRGKVGEPLEVLEEIPIDQLTLDPFADIVSENVDKYSKLNTEIPPIEVHREDGNNDVYDGNTRVIAAKKKGLKTIKAWVSTVGKDGTFIKVSKEPAPTSQQTGEPIGSEVGFRLDDNDTFFHASNKKRQGRLKSNTATQFGEGIYFSTDKDTVQNEFGEHVTEASLDLKNPVFTNTKEWNKVEELAIENAIKDYNKKKGLTENDNDFKTDWDIYEIPSKFISNAAKELGYDAIIDKGSGNYKNEILVLDESRIIYPEDKKLSTQSTSQQTGNSVEVKPENKTETEKPSIDEREVTHGVIGKVGKFISRIFGGKASEKVFIAKDEKSLIQKANELQRGGGNPMFMYGDAKTAKSVYDKAVRNLKAAEDKISQKQATQTGLFGKAAQGEMFGVGRDEAKDILDPLRQKVKEAKAEWDKEQQKAIQDATGQQTLFMFKEAALGVFAMLNPMTIKNSPTAVRTEQVSKVISKDEKSVIDILNNYYKENDEVPPKEVIDRALYLWDKFGRPEISGDSSKNDDRAFATNEGGKNRMGNITNFDDFVAELAHAAQFVSGKEMDDRAYPSQAEKDKKEYDRKGSMEYKAHKEIEPILAKYIFSGDTANLNKIAYRVSGQKEVLGFTFGGKIYLNGEHLNPNTPIHEAGHIWTEWAKQNDTKVYNKGIELVNGSKYLKEVKADKFYQAEAGKLPENEREQYFQHEALATAIGDKGAQFVSESRKTGFKEWLNNLWTNIKNAAGFKDISNKDFQNLTLDEFAKRAAKDILDTPSEEIQDTQIPFDEFKDNVLNMAEGMKDSSFDWRISLPDMPQKDREKAVSDIRAGKESVQAKRLLNHIQDMYDKGIISMNRGRGNQAQRTDFTHAEWFGNGEPLTQKEIDAAEKLDDRAVEIINNEGITLNNIDNIKHLFNGFPYEQSDFQEVRSYLERQGESNAENQNTGEQGKGEQPEKQIEAEDTGDNKPPPTQKRSKLLDLADRIEKEGFLPSWAKADLPEGTQLQGFNFNKAVADAIRLVDAALKKGVEISKAIEEGFNSIRQHYKDNNAKFKDEEKLKSDFAKFVHDNFEENKKEEKELTSKELAAKIKSGELNYNEVIDGKDEAFIKSLNDELFGKDKKTVSFDEEAFKEQVRKQKEFGLTMNEIIEVMGAAKKLTKKQRELVAQVFGETAETDKIAEELKEAFKQIAKGEKPKSVLKRLSISSVTDLVDALKNALTYTAVSNDQLEQMADYIVVSIDLNKADQYINAIVDNAKFDVKQLLRAKVIIALQKEGNKELATRLIEDMADEATQAGRQTQSLKRAYELLGAKGNPATRTAFMRRVVAAVQEKASKMNQRMADVISNQEAEIGKLNEKLHQKAQSSSLITKLKDIISDLCGLRNKK